MIILSCYLYARQRSCHKGSRTNQEYRFHKETIHMGNEKALINQGPILSIQKDYYLEPNTCFRSET